MLALSRTEGQSIIIDGIIEVKVVKWSRNSVRLAIQAPREVSIDRDEIWKRIHPGEKSPMEKADLHYGHASDAAATDRPNCESSRPSARMEVPQVNGLVRHPPAATGSNGHNGTAKAAL
jgi:carbon storage regulator